MMSLLGIMDLAACEAIKTSVALITTSLAGAVVWLLTLRFRSGQIRILLSHPRRKFDFFVRGEDRKQISFMRNGAIGDGRNHNEHRWRIRFGLLEIFDCKGIIHSKFRWDKTVGELRHINDPKLPSVMGQRIKPLLLLSDSPECKAGGVVPWRPSTNFVWIIAVVFVLPMLVPIFLWGSGPRLGAAFELSGIFASLIGALWLAGGVYLSQRDLLDLASAEDKQVVDKLVESVVQAAKPVKIAVAYLVVGAGFLVAKVIGEVFGLFPN